MRTSGFLHPNISILPVFWESWLCIDTALVLIAAHPNANSLSLYRHFHTMLLDRVFIYTVLLPTVLAVYTPKHLYESGSRTENIGPLGHFIFSFISFIFSFIYFALI